MPDNTQRKTDRSDPRAVRPADDTGIASGSVNDAAGAAGHLAGSESAAVPDEPRADSGIIHGAMTNPRSPDASTGDDQDLASRTARDGLKRYPADLNAADTPMPVNEEAAEVEQRGIARNWDELADEQRGGSHA